MCRSSLLGQGRRAPLPAIVLAAASFLAAFASTAAAQDRPHDHSQMNMATGGWHLMQDAVVFAELNHQSGPRGGTEMVAPNWWMGMASRDTSRGRLTLSGMFSLEPATVGRDGYRELFQSGEALDGRPLVDRQHPHDFFMQLSAAWRLPIASTTGFTLAGGPAGEPALGPVAFMHRASAYDNPTAPLGHHTFDSTHIAFGVITAGVDHGPIVAEASIFNGREPDQHRWNMDFGRLDSFSGRLWYRPTPEWEFQFSAGRLTDPEELEPGNIVRTTASQSWTKRRGNDFSAVTFGVGHNATDHGSRSAMFLEGTERRGLYSLYARFEAVQAESTVLRSEHAGVDDHEGNDAVLGLTLGIVRDVWKTSRLEGGFGTDVTFYGAPSSLDALYGDRPFGFRVFFRLRPAPGAMGRMLNMRMAQPHP